MCTHVGIFKSIIPSFGCPIWDALGLISERSDPSQILLTFNKWFLRMGMKNWAILSILALMSCQTMQAVWPHLDTRRQTSANLDIPESSWRSVIIVLGKWGTIFQESGLEGAWQDLLICGYTDALAIPPPHSHMEGNTTHIKVTSLLRPEEWLHFHFQPKRKDFYVPEDLYKEHLYWVLWLDAKSIICPYQSDKNMWYEMTV